MFWQVLLVPFMYCNVLRCLVYKLFVACRLPSLRMSDFYFNTLISNILTPWRSVLNVFCVAILLLLSLRFALVFMWIFFLISSRSFNRIYTLFYLLFVSTGRCICCFVRLLVLWSIRAHSCTLKPCTSTTWICTRTYFIGCLHCVLVCD